MHRKVLHDVNAINAIKIAGRDIVAKVRYYTVFTFLFQRSNHSILLFGRSQYEEIANLSEDEDRKEDVAKATEDGMVLPIILRL